MSNKTENIKNFINQTGKENQLFLFVGSNNKNTGANSAVAALETWKDSDFSVKIGKDNLIAVAKNIKWQKSRVYFPWNSKFENDGVFYAYNEINGYVYLCISNNADHRKDLSGKNASTIIPSHVVGDQTYEDGYTWKALYRITPNLERFVTDQWIPVVSFDTFESLNKNNELVEMQSYCYPASTSNVGKCSLYFKENTQYYNSAGVLTNGLKGSSFYTFTTLTCSECYNMFKDHPTYVSIFSTTEPLTNIEIKDAYDMIGDMINSGRIPASSPYYYLYQANKNSPDEGYIVSIDIDLSSFDQKDRAISEENPYVIVTSNSGSGASIRLKTYNDEGTNYVYGIELTSQGSGYKDLSLSIPSVTMLGAKTTDDLLAAIDYNLDDIDGLGFDPIAVLGSKHVMIDVRIDKTNLASSDLPMPSHINFYSLIQNPKFDSGSFEVVAGANENKYLSTLYRTTTKLSVTAPVVGGSSVLPPEESIGDISLPTADVIKNVTVVKATPPASAGQDSKIEIKTMENRKIKEILEVGGVLSIDGFNYTINTVDSQPSLVQYTGKILSSNKTSDIQVDDVDTVTIRINMVKGM